MRQVLILGGGGMVGQKLLSRLQAEGLDGDRNIEITLHDLAFSRAASEGVVQITGDLSQPGAVAALIQARPDVIFDLASIVSGEAERDFEKGWQTNMFAMWYLLDSIKSEHEESGGTYCPRLVFTSSIAVFGGPYPEKIGDEFLSAPQTSYGAQKAVCEAMLSDFSRKGYLDGVSIRLPTITVRPGKPNLAASSFFSSIIREPLNGQTAILPVPDTVRHWHASPRSAAGFLTHAATLDLNRLGGRRALNMPGLSCTVAEQIEALRRVAGQSAVDLIQSKPDPDIMRMVGGWPRDFDTIRARDLGFVAESSYDEIIAVYMAEDMSLA
ncbi:MAG: D-erythronate dehydrogenase [Paracoccaceae bacterium]